ncbi:hypothetical protein HYDPIDRAFT_99561, partial [Hydnomerulius pinastri MD-312]
LHKKSRGLLPFPPGPTGWPLLGNIPDFPKQWAPLIYADIGKNAPGHHFIILNSAKAASDLLDKRGAVYSNRPYLTMACDLPGMNDYLLYLQYGERFRQSRKLFHRTIGTGNSITAFYPAEVEESLHFLRNVLKHPEDVAIHVRRSVGALILRISHGYIVEDDNDPMVSLAQQAMENLSLVGTPGAYPVDHLPFLRLLPEWLPGTAFLRDAKHFHRVVIESITKPHQFVLH